METPRYLKRVIIPRIIKMRAKMYFIYPKKVRKNSLIEKHKSSNPPTTSGIKVENVEFSEKSMWIHLFSNIQLLFPLKIFKPIPKKKYGKNQ